MEFWIKLTEQKAEEKTWKLDWVDSIVKTIISRDEKEEAWQLNLEIISPSGKLIRTEKCFWEDRNLLIKLFPNTRDQCGAFELNEEFWSWSVRVDNVKTLFPSDPTETIKPQKKQQLSTRKINHTKDWHNWFISKNNRKEFLIELQEQKEGTKIFDLQDKDQSSQDQKDMLVNFEGSKLIKFDTITGIIFVTICKLNGSFIVTTSVIPLQPSINSAIQAASFKWEKNNLRIRLLPNLDGFRRLDRKQPWIIVFEQRKTILLSRQKQSLQPIPFVGDLIVNRI